MVTRLPIYNLSNQSFTSLTGSKSSLNFLASALLSTSGVALKSSDLFHSQFDFLSPLPI